MDGGSKSSSYEDVEAMWSRKPQQLVARRKKERARSNSATAYRVIVMFLLFSMTAGIVYLVYNGTDTSSLLRSSGLEQFCASQPCKNGGVCLEGANGFYCFCGDSWVGKQCETDIDECKTSPCGTDGNCTNTPGGYSCSCVNGFAGVPCKDVDECADDPCDPHAACANSVGSYMCTCNLGFIGNGTSCEDEDECAGLIDKCPNYHCLNSPGSFSCGCRDGFTDTGSGCVEATTASLTSAAPDVTETKASTKSITSTSGTPPTMRTTTADTISTTEGTTTLPATTMPPTTAEPAPDVSWVEGYSVSKYNITEDDGTTIIVDSGWKVGSNMNEAISNAAYYNGSQCWYYTKGWNTGLPGGSTPFSPALNLKVGRSDGAYNGDVDSFYASFWFKMAKDYTDRWGDGTRIMVVAGDPDGTTGSSNHLEINFPKVRRAKLSVRTKESYPSYQQCAQSKDCGDDFGYVYSDIAEDLDPTTWHHVEMTLRSQPQDYADQWSYLIDGTHSHQGGAFYKTQQYDNGQYLYVNRLNFASLKVPSDGAIKGIYFDEVTYWAFDSSDPNVIRDEYSTSFEP